MLGVGLLQEVSAESRDSLFGPLLFIPAVCLIGSIVLLLWEAALDRLIPPSAQKRVVKCLTAIARWTPNPNASVAPAGKIFVEEKPEAELTENGWKELKESWKKMTREQGNSLLSRVEDDHPFHYFWKGLDQDPAEVLREIEEKESAKGELALPGSLLSPDENEKCEGAPAVTETSPATLKRSSKNIRSARHSEANL